MGKKCHSDSNRDVSMEKLGIISIQSHQCTESPMCRRHVTREKRAGRFCRRPFTFSPEGLAGVTLDEGAWERRTTIKQGKNGRGSWAGHGTRCAERSGAEQSRAEQGRPGQGAMSLRSHPLPCYRAYTRDARYARRYSPPRARVFSLSLPLSLFLDTALARFLWKRRKSGSSKRLSRKRERVFRCFD